MTVAAQTQQSTLEIEHILPNYHVTASIVQAAAVIEVGLSFVYWHF